MGFKNWLTTLGLGAGLMYFYDPEQGKRRRAVLRDQWTCMQNDTQDFWEKASRDLQNRAQGIRSEPPSLQAGKPSMGGLGGLEGSWSPGVRLVAGAGGGFLTLYGLAKGGLKGMAATFVGLNLVARGVADKDFRSFMNQQGQQGAIDFQKMLTVNVPVQQVFDFWRNYQNFPKFMSHVVDVKDTGNGRSHWVVEGPAGSKVEWDAIITDMEPNRLLAWESMPGSEVHNAGRVEFQDMGQSTQVNVHLSYNPPAGAVGHAVAAFFGMDPMSAVDDDMGRLKSLLEQGKQPAGSGQTTASSQQKATPDGSGQARTATQAPTTGSAQGGSQPRGETPPTAKPGTTSGTGSQGQQGKAQSGMPGGGQGRVDEVGQTGVYPASDPNAPADAKAQGMASWGQGERGAAGYEDSGTSELNLGPEPGMGANRPKPGEQNRGSEKSEKKENKK